MDSEAGLGRSHGYRGGVVCLGAEPGRGHRLGGRVGAGPCTRSGAIYLGAELGRADGIVGGADEKPKRKLFAVPRG